MSFDPVKPKHTIPFAAKEIVVEGNFALLEAIEFTLKDGILRIITRVMDMHASEFAKLLDTLFQSKATPEEIRKTLWNEIGMSGDEHTILRMHVYAALRIFVSPPSGREKAASEMGEMLGKWKAASLGNGSTSSASVD